MTENNGPFIRLRDQVGRTTNVNGTFVEICDEKGRIGALVYMTSSGIIRVVQPYDKKEVTHYEKTFGVKFCNKLAEVTEDDIV